MDPHTNLEYALFQLTPTRTRCDLLIFCGNNKEKLASGLVEPFVSHLKFFKDQISKGGYSITLRPPINAAFCFTKYTFQRLVRFINSPEVLERFIRIEREISQIENSVNGNDGEEHAGEGSLSSSDGSTKKSADTSKLKAGEAGDHGQEENSKIQLQRLLETRKAMLRKEQAMAYARALVAGFDPENMIDLVSFADNFGASRLREACIEFKDLCKKKHNDGLWMDELAAMAAFPPSELAYTGDSGLLITTESNASDLNFIAMQNGSEQTNPEVTQAEQVPSTPTNAGMRMQWPNQIPQYMYNFPGPQGPRYPYPYPGMPPYYPPHMSWPPNADDSNHGRHHKSSSKKKSKPQFPESSEEEEDDDDSNGESDSVSDSGTVNEKSTKKNKKKSSKRVVIRNINYITSNRKNSDDSDEDEVNGVLESLAKHRNKSSKTSKKKGAESEPESESGKRNENWDAFQNLILKDDVEDEHFTIRNSEDGSFLAKNNAIDMGSENFVKNRPKTGINDSFVVPERSGVNESRKVNSQDFENGESFRAKGLSDADMVVSGRFRETEMDETKSFRDLGSESSTIRNKREEDWFVVKNSENTIGKSTFDHDYGAMKNDVFSSETSKKIVPIDDSFMVQPQTAAVPYDSQWRSADVSMVENVAKPDATNGSGNGSVTKTGFYEPDDLYLMVSRDSGVDPPVRSSWAPDVDYGNEVSFTKTEPKPAPVETKEQTEEVSVKTKKKVMKPRPLSKSLPTDKRLPFVRTPIVHKSKREQEDEIRKRVEELAIQRQKRIAERSAAKTGAGGSPGSGSRTKTGATTPAKPVNKKTNLKAT